MTQTFAHVRAGESASWKKILGALVRLLNAFNLFSGTYELEPCCPVDEELLEFMQSVTKM